MEKVRGNDVDFSTIKITLKKVRGNDKDFSISEITSKKYVETKWIFRPSKSHRKKYVKTTRIFSPPKLHRKKYVETTWIFRSAKLHRKSTWKRRGNSSKFGLRRIDVISTSNRRRFDVVCPLGSIASTSLQQRQSISLASFLQCPHLHPIGIFYSNK